MCQFKSAIVVRDEGAKGGIRLLMSPWTESHSELITIFKLRDNDRLTFARVEFSPSSMAKAYLVEEYKLRLDEERMPDWWNAEIEVDVTERMRAYIKSIIVDGDVELLIGGQFVIAPNAKVQCAKSMVINAICGGTVSAICGGTVSEIRGGTVSEIWEYFRGIIGTIGPNARILSDERPKPAPAPEKITPNKPAKKSAKQSTKGTK